MCMKASHTSVHSKSILTPLLLTFLLSLREASPTSAQQLERGETLLSVVLQSEQSPRGGQSNPVPSLARAHAVLASL